APASFSLMTAMICSSPNRLRFMGHPPPSIQRWKIPARNGPDPGEKVRRSDLNMDVVDLKNAANVRFIV
ncbi:MAG: hypothetical protein AAF577_16885, partial [Pseudomonadota bacterium]